MTGETPAPLWTGRLVRLRPPEPADWERFHGDSLDTDAQRYGSQIEIGRSTEGARRWAEEKATVRPESDDYFWSIESLERSELVGAINVHSAHRRNGTFEYGISIFRQHWRRGYAIDAIYVLLKYYFSELRYEKANAVVYAFNERSLGMHRSAGFTEEGRMRSQIYTDGKRHDVVLFGMTREEYLAIAKKNRPPARRRGGRNVEK